MFEKYEFILEDLQKWSECYAKKSKKFPKGMDYDLILPNKYKISFSVGEMDVELGEEFIVCDLSNCGEVHYIAN